MLLESITVNTCELEPLPRMAAAMKLPVLVLLAKASELLVCVLASMLRCCTRVMLLRLDRLVSEKLACPETPEADAVTVYGPTVVLAVKVGAVAMPCAFVMAVFVIPANVPLAPIAGAVNVTVTPLTGLCCESVTVACNGVAKALLMAAFCRVPALAKIFAAGPGRLVREKFAGVATPATEAVTVYEPATALAVKIPSIAWPAVSVKAVVRPPAKVPLAPLAGTVNVTVTLLTGLFEASLTVTWSPLVKPVLTVALCGVPPVAVTLAGGPERLVSEKLAIVPTPGDDAVTV